MIGATVVIVTDLHDSNGQPVDAKFIPRMVIAAAFQQGTGGDKHFAERQVRGRRYAEEVDGGCRIANGESPVSHTSSMTHGTADERGPHSICG